MAANIQHIHQGQPILAAGEPLDQPGRAKAAMVMVHGRGASAEDILGMASEFRTPGFAYLAPQAANHTWYPQPFQSPIASNEPFLSSALAVLEKLIAEVNAAGIPTERIILLGFSQGASLSLEFAARHGQRYGGIAGLSGSVIGPGDAPRAFDSPAGSLAGTPVFLGCSDVDPFISKKSVEHTANVMRGLGADVIKQLYPNMDHTVNRDEIAHVNRIMAALLTA